MKRIYVPKRIPSGWPREVYRYGYWIGQTYEIVGISYRRNRYFLRGYEDALTGKLRLHYDH